MMQLPVLNRHVQIRVILLKLVLLPIQNPTNKLRMSHCEPSPTASRLIHQKSLQYLTYTKGFVRSATATLARSQSHNRQNPTICMLAHHPLPRLTLYSVTVILEVPSNVFNPFRPRPVRTVVTNLYLLPFLV